MPGARTGVEAGGEYQGGEYQGGEGALLGRMEALEEEEMDEETKALVSEIERSLEEDSGGGVGGEPMMVHIHQHTGKRRVQFKEGEALTSEFDDTNLWAHGGWLQP